MFYFGKLVRCLFWIISIVTDKVGLIINIIVIIVFVLNYVYQYIFLSDYCNVMLVTIKK